jgi:agmatinase
MIKVSNISFGGLESEYTNYANSKILLQSVPYDGTSTWGKGADKGFDAFIDASENMELYDIETDSEVYKHGICCVEPISEIESPENMFEQVYKRAKEMLSSEKFITFFGGEHSISIGVIKANYEKHDNLTVLQLDAHADLRKDYLGTPYNHACALHDASQNTNLIQVGIRSMDSCEKQYMDYDKCFFADRIASEDSWIDESIALMTDSVYLTIDLDVFDPSIMPSTGTPEPGGMTWYQVIEYLKKVFNKKNVVGFDIVELAPKPNNRAPEFLAAKLYYKLLTYKFCNDE